MLRSHSAIYNILVGLARTNQKLIIQLGQFNHPLCVRLTTKHNLTQEDFVALCRSAYTQSLTQKT